MFKRIFHFLMALVFSLFCVQVPSWAIAQELSLLGEIRPPQQASEYIYRSSPKESLISVQLLGAVNKPGIYYIPANTDLLKLLTLAGGSTSDGDLSEILVRKSEPQSWLGFKSKAIDEYQGAYEVDAKKIIKYGGFKNLKLAQDDFIYIPARQPWISSDVARTVTVFSLILGIALTAVLIQKDSNNK